MTVINEDSTVMYEDKIAGGSHWSMLIRQGITLRLIDPEGGANVGMLLYNPDNKLERYNAPDTLKAQHTFKLTQGHCLYSDMGHIFCSITHDTVGWHDTVGGYLCDDELVKKYGSNSYQEYRNEWTISGEHGFLVELAKYELNDRDMAANVNFFSKVVADDKGDLSFYPANSQAGDFVDLRFDMDCLVILSTAPHPMNPSLEYPSKPITYQLRKTARVLPDDECFNSCDENKRGLRNNQLYHLSGEYE